MKLRMLMALVMFVIAISFGVHRALAADMFEDMETGGACECRLPNQEKFGKLDPPGKKSPDSNCVIDMNCWVPIGQ